MTLLVRNEQDLLRTNIEYHLSRGVDFIIATDNLSTDATADILHEYERQGVLRYIYEPSDDYSQDIWVTRMARLAATEHDANWIFHVDADEFWWPERHASLPQVFAAVSPDTDGLYVGRSNFIRPADMDESLPFHAAMSIRDCESVNPLGRPLPGKVAHRAFTKVLIDQGNHGFSLEDRQARCEDSSDVLIFHYPLRDYASFRKRIAEGGAAYEKNTRLSPNIGRTWRELYARLQLGTLRQYFDEQCVSRQSLESGFAAQRYVLDQRMHDYLK